MARDDVIRFRATAAFKSKMQATAEAAGVPLSEYVRVAVKEAARGGMDPNGLRQALVDLRREVNAAGSNMNQLVRLAHGRGDLVESEVAAIRRAWEDMRGALNAALRGDP